MTAPSPENQAEDGAPVAPALAEFDAKTSDVLARRASVLLVKSGATVRATIAGPPALPGTQTAVPLPTYRTSGDPAEGDERPALSVGGLLGEGGMGVVHLAQQTSLRRDVAIKRVRDDQDRDDGPAALMREAVITGALEHPNIVPVYDLAQAEDARPFLMMKRIDGRPWEEQLLGRRVEERRGDWLEAQLRVLMSVCDAVRFAHSRGIIHRDLKPENVMLGKFGEVLVVDWGVAVGMNEAHRGLFPLAVDSHHIAGTPAYMSPEQVAGVGAGLGRHTDVYLLGAMLYEILTGTAPHDAATVHASLFSAHESAPPTLPDHVPEPLANICRKAMNREPTERYEDAADVHEALSEYLRHRASIEITEKALALSRELAATPTVDPDALDAASLLDPHGVHKRFSRCKFGFLQALDIWQDNRRARDGLQDVLTLMIGRSLDAGELVQAGQLMQELPADDPTLRARLREAKAAQRKARLGLQKLGALGARHDLRVGRNPRLWFTLGLAVVWPGICLLSWWWQQQGTLTGLRHTTVAAVAVALTLAYTGVRHRGIRMSGLNQRMLHMAAMTAVSVFALRLYAWQGQITPEIAQPAELLLFFSGMGAVSAMALRRLAYPALIYAVASALAAIDASTVFLVSAAAHVLTLGLASVILDRAAKRRAHESG